MASGTLVHILMADSMEAIATDFVLGIEVVRDGIAEGLFGHSLVESRIEDHKVFSFLRENLLSRFDSYDTCRVMQRSQRNHLAKFLHNLRSYTLRSREFSSVNDPVSYILYLTYGLDHPNFFIGKISGHFLESHFMIVEVHFLAHLIFLTIFPIFVRDFTLF